MCQRITCPECGKALVRGLRASRRERARRCSNLRAVSLSGGGGWSGQRHGQPGRGPEEALRLPWRRAGAEAIVKAVIESAGKVASRVRLGTHELIFDQPAPVPGGDDRGPSPLDVLGVSVAACVHYYAAAFLARSRPAHRRSDRRGGVEKARVPAPRLGRLSMKVRLPAGLSERQLATVERAIRSCPAYGTLLHPPSVELVIGLR